jgi:hypothetical protein
MLTLSSRAHLRLAMWLLTHQDVVPYAALHTRRRSSLNDPSERRQIRDHFCGNAPFDSN